MAVEEVIALPCFLYSMELTVLHLTVRQTEGAPC
jgi:hypothetical protein